MYRLIITIFDDKVHSQTCFLATFLLTSSLKTLEWTGESVLVERSATFNHNHNDNWLL